MEKTKIAGTTIKKAKKNDAAAIYKFGKKIPELGFSTKYPFHELSEIKEFISRPKENILFTAKAKGKVIGFIYAKILSTHAGGWCMLDNLAVEKKYRNNGTGEKLLKALYAELKKRKTWYVQVLEEKHYKKARAFWKKMGYKETKTFIWAEKTIR